MTSRNQTIAHAARVLGALLKKNDQFTDQAIEEWHSFLEYCDTLSTDAAVALAADEFIDEMRATLNPQFAVRMDPEKWKRWVTS